jgi:hypothetical protein
MNENEIKRIEDVVVKTLSEKLETELEKKITNSFKWVKFLLVSLTTLFLAFVGLSLTNMIGLTVFKGDIQAVITDLKNQDQKNSDNIKSIKIEIALPVQLALAKACMVEALQTKDMATYYKYSEIVTQLQIDILKFKYSEEEKTRGSK